MYRKREKRGKRTSGESGQAGKAGKNIEYRLTISDFRSKENIEHRTRNKEQETKNKE
jgi:hypothetical protein